MRRIFKQSKEEVIGGLKNISDKDLHNLHSLLDIIMVTNSKRIRWVADSACMGEIRNEYIF
jgi:hypothetical protein